jgi:hypothetical protein
MTLRIVTPASGHQVTVTYGGSPGGPSCSEMLRRGQVIDVAPGSPLETALGANITALTGAALTRHQQGTGAAVAN